MIIDYPNILNKIFDKLKINHIKPILIGGYVRDSLLQCSSNDIDIEVYGVNSFDKLEEILQEFGDVNSVGRSFGVCKLAYEGLELDFSLPRQDSKVSDGHRGFEVKVDPSLDFINATKRRDFTINAIGYDVFEKKILDPFHGLDDLHDKVLRTVDKETFVEDPLRVLRLVQFAARFEMHVDGDLFSLCKNMVKEREFKELAPERVYEEIKKLLLKSPKPSLGIKILHDLGLHKEWIALDEVDSLARQCQKLGLKGEPKGSHPGVFGYVASASPVTNSTQVLHPEKGEPKGSHPRGFGCVASASPTQKESLRLYFSLLYNKETLPLLSKITTDVKLLKNIATFIDYSDYLPSPFENITNYQLFFLATKVKLRLFFLFLDARTLRRYSQKIETLCQRASDLNILDRESPALLQGRDLLEGGLKPSQEFKKILNTAYEAQMHAEFQDKEKALLWLQNHLDYRD